MKWFSTAIQHLNNNELILCPTDTIWGISASMNLSAVQQLQQLKQRPISKSFILLVADINMLKDYVEELPEQVLTYLKQENRPTTVIYNKPKNIPNFLLAQDGSIAIRVASTEWLKEFINQYGEPILSTSANISGQLTATNFNTISNEIKQAVAYTVPHLHENNSTTTSSRIIKLNEQNQFEIIRD